MPRKPSSNTKPRGPASGMTRVGLPHNLAGMEAALKRQHPRWSASRIRKEAERDVRESARHFG